MKLFIIFIFGLLGMIGQSLKKIIKINGRTPETVSIGQILKQHVRSDFANLALSLIFLFVWISVYDAFISTGTEKDPIPWIDVKYVKTVIIFIDAFTAILMYFSQDIIMSFTNRTEKAINAKLGSENASENPPA